MKKVSYSQYSLWKTCPYQWKLQYVDKIKTYEPSIHTIFGSAMHEAIQLYLNCMFNFTFKEADQLDLNDLLRRSMKEFYHIEVVETEKLDLVSRDDMVEFYMQGEEILDWFKKKRGQYFNKKGWSLLGIEDRIAIPIRGNLHFLGFLDVVLKDEISGKIKIIDIKTATMGWNKYQKADKTKTAQLVLYKSYYAKQFNVPVDNIRVEYFIVKRKLWENTDFPQKRVQLFTPASGKPTLNKINRSVDEFVRTSFNEDGSYNTNRVYPAIGGKNKKNCKYCEFRDRHDLCPVRERICE